MIFKLKKILAVLISLNLITGSLLPLYAGAEGSVPINPSHKTEIINVAEGKPVITSDIHEIEGHAPSNITDGERCTYMLSEFGDERASSEIITVDLLRRYNVTKVELFDRWDLDMESGRQFIDIIGANKSDLSDAVTLGSLGEKNDDSFAHQSSFKVDVNGNNAYRYIAVKRTGGGNYHYAELRVWAEQTVTNISKNIDLKNIICDNLSDDSHWVYDFATADNAFDENKNTTWIEEGNAHRYLRVDLGDEYNIGMIEMSGRDFSADNQIDDPWGRMYINMYGTNSTDTSSNIFDAFSAPESDSELLEKGFKKLARVTTNDGGYNSAIDSEKPFPSIHVPEGSESVNGKAGMFQSTCDDSEAFRYFIIKKTQPTSISLSTISLYVVNPVVNRYDIRPDGIYVNFSDEMDEASFNNTTVKFKNADGTDTKADFELIDAYTLKIDTSNLDIHNKYTLELDKSIKNLKNVTLADNCVKDFDTLKTISAEGFKVYGTADCTGDEIRSFHYLDNVSAKVNIKNNSTKDKSVGLFLALYSSSGNLIDVTLSKQTVKANGQMPFTANISTKDYNADGEYIKFYVWEMSGLTPIVDGSVIKSAVTDIYVSPDGNDEYNGTIAKPFKTLKRAQQEVRLYNKTMQSDINVWLKEGTYQLNDTLTLTDADSGNNGYYVNWQPYNNSDVTISGGKQITGWKKRADGVLYASLSGLDTVRELYVNDKKAVRAQSETKIAPLDLYYENDEISGFIVNADDMAHFTKASDIQLHFTRGWASMVLNVESITDNGDGTATVKMQQPAFKMATHFESAGTSNPAEGFSYHIFWLDETNKFYAENVYELMDNPSEFYYNKKTGTIYYIPREGEDASNISVFAPNLEKIIEVKGTDLNKKAKNIRFKNLTIAHGAYNEFDNGVLGDQAQLKIITEKPETAYPLDSTITGANIRVSACENIEFTDNVFYGMAAVGIGLYNGAKNTVIKGNAFYDIGDSAITVGLPTDDFISSTENGANVALFKPTSSSAEEWGNFSAYAVDGDNSRGWNIYGGSYDGDYSDEWWQVDLLKPYKIDTVIMHQRNLTDVERTNFVVMGSNDASFNTGVVILAEQGAEPYGETGSFEAQTNIETPVRYVRVMKTTNEYFYMPEIELISKDETVPLEEVCKDNLISNNYITRVGEYNWGAPGMQTYYTDGTVIDHNYVTDVPYSGICVGWGWTNVPDSVTSRNNIVSNNIIEKFNTISYDGGGIYTLGQNPDSKVFGNYIKNEINAYAAFYPDSGSAHFEVYNNVFEDVHMSLNVYNETQENITAYDNWATTPYYLNYGSSEQVEAPGVYLPTKAPQAVNDIISNAGLEADYKNIISKVPSRYKERTFEEMYSNIIEENNPEILSMPNVVVVRNYLKNKVMEAEVVLELGRPYATADDVSSLRAVIDETKVYTTAKSSVIAKFDKIELVNQHLKIVKAIKDYYNSLS